MTTPLKRHENLKPLSRDHHHGLLLCWKITVGLKNGVEQERIKGYLDYFFSSQLVPHFQFEEAEVFPLLGEDHPMVERALKEHRRLKELFHTSLDTPALRAIEIELNRHIRFEERELFTEIQRVVPEEKIRQIDNKEKKILTPDPDDWADKFWT
ncbi:hemerythrin domain-containing protein [Salinimicrobium oceani]|uniref:Hemerythrin domain-containing protein n=1 Tax=Salinimicrobium oceani TaxID=2722702 RepID=A0ABX1CYE2_9FLAO|nr:hemerythrin domain-containing protein [Salinimicrobium oceani]NJW53277.1 hemerythrin domain-containing protein [Salinimicrobium oceani]